MLLIDMGRLISICVYARRVSLVFVVGQAGVRSAGTKVGLFVIHCKSP
jgi:hypothetical protein